MTTLQELNKINTSTIEAILNSDSWEESTNYSMGVKAYTTEYRNKLLASFAGRTITVKGYLIDKTSPTNYTVALATVYLDGARIDTLHHINVYVDMLSNSSSLTIGGRTVEGKGKYDVRLLTENLKQNKLNDTPFYDCEPVEVEGIAYSYRGKWSVGTHRQVRYAATH
jgi:hypothetical protein